MAALRLIGVLCLLLATLTPSAQAGEDERLVGSWRGDEGEVVKLLAGGVLDLVGSRGTWSSDDAGRLTYSVGGETVTATYTVTDDRLTLVVDGEKIVLSRIGVKATKPPAPGDADEPAHPGARKSPPALEGADAGKATKYSHPRGWYSFDLPQGWTVYQETESGLLLNPGLTESDTLDSIVLLRYGELDDEDRELDVMALVEKSRAGFRQLLAADGIRLEAAEPKASKVAVGEIPGAIVVWAAESGSDTKLRVWTGTIIKREYWLTTIAVLVDAKADRFLPGVKRVFRSLRPTPPEVNRQAQAALAGRRAAKNTTNSSGSFSTIYDFRASGSVGKKMLFSASGPGSAGLGGSSEDSGRWEVIGDTVYLYFKSAQESARLVVKDGTLTGIRFGNTVYSLM